MGCAATFSLLMITVYWGGRDVKWQFLCGDELSPVHLCKSSDCIRTVSTE